jgi:hypothetical protein
MFKMMVDKFGPELEAIVAFREKVVELRIPELVWNFLTICTSFSIDAMDQGKNLSSSN